MSPANGQAGPRIGGDNLRRRRRVAAGLDLPDQCVGRLVGLAPGQEATFRHSYLDDDHECDVFGFSPHRLVRRLVYTGDTRGEDAGVVTGVTASFNPIAVLVVDE